MTSIGRSPGALLEDLQEDYQKVSGSTIGGSPGALLECLWENYWRVISRAVPQKVDYERT